MVSIEQFYWKEIAAFQSTDAALLELFSAQFQLSNGGVASLNVRDSARFHSELSIRPQLFSGGSSQACLVQVLHESSAVIPQQKMQFFILFLYFSCIYALSAFFASEVKPLVVTPALHWVLLQVRRYLALKMFFTG